MIKRKHSYFVDWRWNIANEDSVICTILWYFVGGFSLFIPAAIVGATRHHHPAKPFHHVLWDAWFSFYVGIPLMVWGAFVLVWLINNPPVSIERRERIEYELTKMEKLEARTKALEKAAGL